MLTSIVLGAALLQQDAGDVRKKWAEVQAVWDRYIGVTVETGSYRAHTRTMTILRDGRYLIEVEPDDYAVEHGMRLYRTVDHFDGKNRVQYDAIKNEYTVVADHDPPDWLYPFLLMWGKDSVPWSPSVYQEAPGAQYDVDADWFPLTFIDHHGGLTLMLRSRDLTPHMSFRILSYRRRDFDLQNFASCQPIVYQGHAEWAVEWSVPPGARLVDQLESGV